MSDALGRRIGPDENFFEAGLDSAGMVRVYEQVVGHRARPFPVTTLFAHPNLRALERQLAGTPSDAASGTASGRRPRDRDPRLRAAGRRQIRARTEGGTAHE